MNSDLYNIVVDFFSKPQPEARRVFHGRGHLFPGLEHLVIDWYGPTVLITIYDRFEDITALKTLLVQSDETNQIESILLQQRNERGAPTTLIWGEAIPSCQVKENDLIFEVRPGEQQNSGLFLDMRPLRQWLINNSDKRNVLNLFAYTCSFSVAALAGNARSVCSVDMSKTSIKWGERNHFLNKQDQRRVKAIPHNLFRSWGRITQFGRYNTVIIDPPTRQRGSFDVEKNYAAVLKKLKQLTHKNADIFATLNSPFLEGEYLQTLFEHHAPQCELVSEIPASPEFADKYPERALKIFHYRSLWGGGEI